MKKIAISALTLSSASLMELVVNDENLNEAIKRVKANKGAAGVDGMTVQ
ncbi:hypothetical protein [Macrococcus epidermidis]|nr:hypothetical protein [Macrococcus epidermidis]